MNEIAGSVLLLTLFLISVLNVTFISKYYRNNNRQRNDVDNVNNASRIRSNQKTLAALLVGQSTLIFISQVVHFIQEILSGPRYSWLNHGNVHENFMHVFSETMDFFLFLTPSINIFVYCLISREFRSLLLNLLVSVYHKYF